LPTLLVRPSRKLVLVGYAVCLILGGLWVYVCYQWLPHKSRWFMAVGAVPLLWPLWTDFQKRFTRLSLGDGKLSYSSGFGKITTRILDTAKVRDVHIEQTMLQRMIGTGSIGVDAIGEAGKIVMTGINHPHDVANAILDSCRSQKPNAPPPLIVEDTPPAE
jgi:hypothetical protein